MPLSALWGQASSARIFPTHILAAPAVVRGIPAYAAAGCTKRGPSFESSGILLRVHPGLGDDLDVCTFSGMIAWHTRAVHAKMPEAAVVLKKGGRIHRARWL